MLRRLEPRFRSSAREARESVLLSVVGCATRPCRNFATAEWVFAPEQLWERTGDVGNVVFSCGWLLEGDEVRLYYGGADTCMALATARLADLLAALNPRI